MSGYTPLFGSLTTGTLCGRWPDIGLWPVVLSLADRNGVVDVTTAYLALITGLPEQDVVACLQRFQQPDPMSRTQDHEGRRLELLDPLRSWGWRVVNFGKYREKARLISKTSAEASSGKNAARMKDRRRPPLTAADHPSDSDSDSDKTNTERQFPVPETSSKTERVVEAQQAAPTTAGVRSKRKTGTGSRGTRLPADFELTPERQQYAEQNGIQNAVKVFEKFRNHWTATAGAKGVKLDWDATWRNWVLTESERPAVTTKFDRIMAQISNPTAAQPFPRLRTADEIEADERARYGW